MTCSINMYPSSQPKVIVPHIPKTSLSTFSQEHILRNDKKEADNINDSPITHGTVPLAALPFSFVHLHPEYILVVIGNIEQREQLSASSVSQKDKWTTK